MAIRILVECLTKLKRLDDVEQYLIEGMDHEIRQVSKREQAKTYARLERQRGKASLSTIGEGTGGDGGEDVDSLKEFHIHLHNVLRAFGGIMARFLHLAQILRNKIVSGGDGYNLLSRCSSFLHLCPPFGLVH